MIYKDELQIVSGQPLHYWCQCVSVGALLELLSSLIDRGTLSKIAIKVLCQYMNVRNLN